MSQYHFTPRTYERMITADVPAYGRLQQIVAQQTVGSTVTRILDLGIGTGVTTQAVLSLHPAATVVGIDVSGAMLDAARTTLGRRPVTLAKQRLEDPLPTGPFSLVVSVLAIHHLDSTAKADLFRRVHGELTHDGLFVFGDVVIPTQPIDRPTPQTPDFDRPDTVDYQLGCLTDAGFGATCVWTEGDLAVFRAVKTGTPCGIFARPTSDTTLPGADHGQ